MENNIEIEESKEVGKKEEKQKTSPVWNHFNLAEEGDKTYAQCTIKGCTSKVVYHNSTTALFNHLKFNHPDAYQACLKKKVTKAPRQSTLPIFNSKTHNPSLERVSGITAAIGRFIAFDMRPISTIEGQGFQSLIHYLEPKYEIPCRRVFTETVIPRLYESLKNNILQQLKSANSFGLTFDYWSSIALKSFLTLTVHFCSQDFELWSYVLKTVEVLQSHTGQNTANTVKSILDEFGLKENLALKFFTVSDGASNMRLAGQELSYPHFSCFAHILHNSLKHCFLAPEIQKILEKTKSLIKYFRSSPSKSQKLISMQQRLNLSQVKLKLDVETRWNSVYDSLERLLQSRQAIVNLEIEDKEVKELSLSSNEWEELIQIKNTLSPFQDITEILSSSQLPSISLLKPLMFIILREILQIHLTDGDFTQTIKHLISEDLIERINAYKPVDDILLLASVLDPRFKNMRHLNEDEKKRVQQLLKKKFQEVKKKEEDLPRKESLEATLFETATKMVKNNETMGRVFKSFKSPVKTIDEFKEINNYLEIEELDILDNPLQWWKENCCKYKILSQLARELLCIPATSVPSERIFSKAGNIVSSKRYSLGSKLLNSLIFLAENKGEN